MNNDIEKSYTEVYKILELLGNEYINKIPTELLEFIKANKDDNYETIINSNISLEEQNLLPDTINILAMLKLDYWCANKEEKDELLNILRINENNYQENLKQKYNTDNLFRKTKTNSNIQEKKC